MLTALRLAFAGACALGLLGCLAWAYSLAAPPDPLAVPNKVLRETFRGDPESEAALRRAATPTALAAFVACADPADRAERLTRAARAVRSNRPVAELVLLERAVSQPGVECAGMLATHGEAASALADLPEAQAAYLADFEKAMADPELRETAGDDPLGLVVAKAVPDPDLRRFYRRHREWLAGPLAQLGATEEGGAEPADVLRAARDFHPLTERAVVECQLGPLGVALFARHGALIQAAVERHKLPLGEVLDAVFGNRDELDPSSPEAGADWLGAARGQGPEVWRAVRAAPFALRLLREAGADGAECLRRHAADDVAALLYLQFPDQVPAAASAVARFGDRGLFVLRQYGGPDSVARERFKRLLAANGWRVVPVLSERGMPGLDELEANPRVYDKYFDAEGRPKDKDWWAKVPILGAPVDLANNLARGRPVELEEIGWAALDAADAAIIAATLGAATPAVAAKEAALIAAKQVVKVGAKPAVTRSIRRKLFEAGAAGLARRAAGTPLGFALRGGRLVASSASPLRAATLKVIEVASKLTPFQRKWAVRGLLGVGAYAAYSRPGAGDIQKLAEWVVARVGELAEGAATLLGEQLLKGIEAVLGPLPAGPWRRFVPPATGGVLCAAGFGWGAWPLVRRGRKYGG